MEQAIFFCSLIILICIMANSLSQKIGVPSLLLFMVLGMLFGSDGIFKVPFNNYSLAEQLCSVTLIFIMFYGGFGTNWKVARPVAAPSFLLASLGVVLTAGAVGLFCYYAMGIPFMESLLIGSVISSTDAASVFSILRSKNLNLKNGLASLLEIESGSNDPAAYMLTVICLGILQGSTQPIVLMVILQVCVGILVGLLIAKLSIYVLRNVHLDSGLDTILIVAAALLAYSLALLFGGNGYLSVYIAGLMLGNSRIKNKITLVHFFDGVTGLMQFCLFFLLGLLALPSKMHEITLSALAIAIFLTLIGRPVVVFLLMLPFRRFRMRDKLLVSWAGLRGAASIVFAIMVTVSDVALGTDIFHIVFCVALFSVLLQGTLLPIVSRRLNLVDEDSSVLKTFNDYIDETDMELLQVPIECGHPWAGKSLSKIRFPDDSLVVMIDRQNETIVPNGNTVIQVADKVILSSKKYEKADMVGLTEEVISSGHPWAGQLVRDLDFSDKPGKALIVMIKRAGDTVIPKGNTLILEKDILVLRNE